MPPKSLVTGGAGFIGSHVAHHLKNLGHEVVVLDDMSGGFANNVPSGCELVEASILDKTILENLFKKYQFDYVFHLAAYAAEGLSHFIRSFNYTNNLLGSTNLINLSVNYGIKCFVFTSSIAVYGSTPPPMDESTSPSPEDPYGIAKYAIELDLGAAHHMFGMNYIVFRPHNVYGESQNIGDPYRNVIGIFLNQIMQDKPMTIFGDGTQTRAFSYIDDVAPIIAGSIQEPKAYNEVFNVGADVPYALNQLSQAVAKAMDAKSDIKYLPARNEVQHAYSSHEKVRKFFKVSEPVSLEMGLQKMAAWVKSVGPRKSKPMENIEIRKNLPSIWQHLSS
jgi:UDP-glucose 4-epimerase